MKRDGKQNAFGALKVFTISLLILAFWIWGLDWVFWHYASTSYFAWYIRNGTLVSITTAFFALVWQGLEEQKGLLSWHPAKFFRACALLASVFYMAVTANMAGPLDGVKRPANDFVSISEALWDGLMAVIMNLLMATAVLAWLLVIAPLFYLLTLFTGAPARREIRDTGRRIVVSTKGFVTTITEQASSAPIPMGAIDVSLGSRPFALTNTLNAAALFLLKLLL